MPHFLSTNLHFPQPSFFPLLSSKKRAESGVSPLFQRHPEHCGAYCDRYVGNKLSAPLLPLCATCFHRNSLSSHGTERLKASKTKWFH